MDSREPIAIRISNDASEKKSSKQMVLIVLYQTVELDIVFFERHRDLGIEW